MQIFWATRWRVVPALNHLAKSRGYYFIGCKSAGNNAFFLSNKYRKAISPVSFFDGFVEPKFRDSRNQQGVPDYLALSCAVQSIRDLPVVNVVTNANEIINS